jgi:hypothetical protein
METSMQKTALTLFSALLISGLAVQSAAASEHHARFHRAYNKVMMVGPVGVTPSIRYTWGTNGPNFRVPSTVDEEDPRALPPN